MTKPVITFGPGIVFNEAAGKPSRFYLKGTGFGTSKPSVFVNGVKCYDANAKDGVLSVVLHFHDHPHVVAKKPSPKKKNTYGTGEITVTISVQNNDAGGEMSDQLPIDVYVDNDTSQ